jgi:hypothetical protein
MLIAAWMEAASSGTRMIAAGASGRGAAPAGASRKIASSPINTAARLRVTKRRMGRFINNLL